MVVILVVHLLVVAVAEALRAHLELVLMVELLQTTVAAEGVVLMEELQVVTQHQIVVVLAEFLAVVVAETLLTPGLMHLLQL
jgi:hypothetical protein